MIAEPILMYAAGVAIGGALTFAIVTYRARQRSDLLEILLAETIVQHAYLSATKEIVDDETDEQIADRGAELLEELDLDVVNINEVSDE